MAWADSLRRPVRGLEAEDFAGMVVEGLLDGGELLMRRADKNGGDSTALAAMLAHATFRFLPHDTAKVIRIVVPGPSSKVCPVFDYSRRRARPYRSFQCERPFRRRPRPAREL